MANYSLVSTSKFQPFSFERYMQPIQIYAQLYEQEKAALEQQAAQYGLLSNMVDPEMDKEVYEAMQAYNENLLKQRDIISSIGLTPQGRRDLSALRQQYFTDVAPVKTWIDLRNKDIEKQDTMYAQANGNIVFANDPRKTSLSYYRKGKPLSLESSNLNAALAEASKAFETWAKTYRNTEEGRAFNNDFITYKQITGINDPNVIYDILRRSGKYPQFEQIMDTLETRYHANNPNFSDTDRAKIKNSLLEGASLGIASAYDEKTTIQEDPRVKQQIEDESWYYRFSTQMREDPGKQKEALEVKALLGQIDDPDDPFSTLSTLDAPLNESVDTYAGIRNKLYREDGNLKAEYAGNSKTKEFVNPIAVYNYAKDIYDNTANKGGYTSSTNPKAAGTYPSLNYGESSLAWINAVKKAKEHFGVNSVISEQDYEKLIKLGYNDKMTLADFRYMNDFNHRVDSSVKRSSPTGLNMSKYDKLEDYGYGQLSSTTYQIYEYDENTGKPKGRPKSSKTIFKHKDGGTRTIKFENVGYTLDNPYYFIIPTSDGKKYFVPLGAFGLQFKGAVDKQLQKYGLTVEDIPRLDTESKSALQQKIALDLRELGNDYDKVASETDSNR